MGWLVLLAALGTFVWLLWPSERCSSEGSDERATTSREIGDGTGVLGGEVEDGFVTEYALGRTPRDPRSSDARDLGTALGLMDALDD